MSYVIVYDRKVVKTPKGLVYLVLHGDNNVWDNVKSGRERRVRRWNVWCFNQTEDEIREYFKGWCGREYQEHFRFYGKSEFVDDKGLLRWVENGLKQAHTIEEFAVNQHSLRGFLWWYDDSYHEKCVSYIKSDEDYLSWMNEIEQVKAELTAQGKQVYENLRFGYTDEPVRMPTTIKIEGPCVVKYGKFYLSEIRNGNAYSGNADFKKAIVFESQKKAEHIAPNWFGKYPRVICSSKKVQQSRADAKYALRFERKHGATTFVAKKTRSYWHQTYDPQYAKRYNKGNAQKNLKRAQSLKENGITASIVELDEKGNVVAVLPETA